MMFFKIRLIGKPLCYFSITSKVNFTRELNCQSYEINFYLSSEDNSINFLRLGAMSDEAIADASEVKPAAAPISSSFSVTDILSPLEVVANSTQDYVASRPAGSTRTDLEYMGPASPSADSVSATSNTENSTNATNNNFPVYSTYSPRSTTPITSMTASAAAAVAATTASYPHMHSMTQLNAPASGFSSTGYCQPNSASDLSHHYPDHMRSSAAASATGWYSSPAADPRFASEYCKFFLLLKRNCYFKYHSEASCKHFRFFKPS